MGPAEASGNLVSLDGISVWLSGHEVLRDVSFSVRPGEFTGLIGSNGAGKTTILRVILGLQEPTAGRVLVKGKAGARHNRSVGYVPQKVLIDPDLPLRARDVVGLGLDGHRFGLSTSSGVRRRRIEEMLGAVDAAGFADSRMGNLSGGEQQRVLIAHALIGQPELLLLDEPLANLDIASGHEIVELMRRVATEHHVAVLLSAHDMNPLLPAMERVVYVAAGRAASGTVDEVVRSEVLSELYGHPVTVLRVEGRILVVAGSHDQTEILASAPHWLERT